MYHKDSLSAAHRTLDFGTEVKVTNLQNKRIVIVKINDRGPFISGRIIDLSKRAMQKLDGLAQGVIEVEVEVIKPD